MKPIDEIIDIRIEGYIISLGAKDVSFTLKKDENIGNLYFKFDDSKIEQEAFSNLKKKIFGGNRLRIDDWIVEDVDINVFKEIRAVKAILKIM